MKNKKIIIWLFSIVAIFAVMSFISRGASSANHSLADAAGSGILSAAENSHDFGEISMAAGKVSYAFVIKNTSVENAVIRKIYTSCMCTEATLLFDGKTYGPFGMQGHGFIPSIDKILAPNTEASVEVTFDPAAHGPAGIGKIDRTVFIENGGGSPVELRFTAFVKP